MKRQPNILFAIADDASHMSAYGHRFVKTPSFDQVAEGGILFANAFTTNPKCAPSRASILTGMHTWQLEDACCHFGLFSAKFAVYPTLLEHAGYHVGFTGKGWAPGDFTRGGFPHNPAGHAYNDRFLTPPPQSGISKKDYAANFEDFLNERPDKAPFCFWYGAHEPHRHYERGEGLRGGKTIDKVIVPPYWPDNIVVKEDMVDYAYEIEWFDQHLGKMLAKLKDIGEFENTLIVVTSDNGAPFPRIKGQMYEDDFHLPLAICWKEQILSGRIVQDMVSFIDFAPTFLQVAGVDIHPQMPGKNLLDIFSAKGSGQVEPHRDHVYMGKERHDLGRENDTGYPVRCLRTRDYLYVRNFHPERWPAGNPETGFTNVDSSPTKDLILAQHKAGEEYYYDLNFGKRPAEELYDMRTDTACLHNLANMPAYRKLQERLWAQLEQALKAHGDPRIFGRGDVFDVYEYVGDARHSWKNYRNGTWQKQQF